MISLRRLLTLGLAGIIVFTTVVSGWFSYREGLREANELFDAKLAHSARVLQGLLDDSLSGAPDVPAPEPLVIEVWRAGPEHVADGEGELAFVQGHVYETELAFQVWDSNGRLRVHSEDGLVEPLAPLQAGFSRQTHLGQRWRVFAVRSESGHWYVVGEENQIRRSLARQIAAGIVIPPLLTLPLMIGLVWLLLGWGVRDLRGLVRQINARAGGRLDPIAVGRTPREVSVIIASVNALLGRLRSALERERRFTGDAAHELRTPITALRIHLDNLRFADDAVERQHAIESLELALQRLSRLIEQMLLLSRLEPGESVPHRAVLALRPCVEMVLDEPAITKLAAGFSLQVRFSDEDLSVLADATSVELLVRNLLDNALRYTPDGGIVRLSLAAENGDQALLTIEDSGPGIPPEARERVFERFHRELGTERDGSGLGLSIVRRLVDVLGARIALDESPALGGLRVRVWLPLTRADDWSGSWSPPDDSP